MPLDRNPYRRLDPATAAQLKKARVHLMRSRRATADQARHGVALREHLLTLRNEGVSLRTMADALGVSRERIRQYLG